MRPGGPAAIPLLDPTAADPFALRDNLDAKPTPEVLVCSLCLAVLATASPCMST